ncbi:MAG: hypothetical protein MHM6MM_002570 [Cercozoa sp. M6MM]
MLSIAVLFRNALKQNTRQLLHMFEKSLPREPLVPPPQERVKKKTAFEEQKEQRMKQQKVQRLERLLQAQVERADRERKTVAMLKHRVKRLQQSLLETSGAMIKDKLKHRREDRNIKQMCQEFKTSQLESTGLKTSLKTETEMNEEDSVEDFEFKATEVDDSRLAFYAEVVQPNSSEIKTESREDTGNDKVLNALLRKDSETQRHHLSDTVQHTVVEMRRVIGERDELQRRLQLQRQEQSAILKRIHHRHQEELRLQRDKARVQLEKLTKQYTQARARIQQLETSADVKTARRLAEYSIEVATRVREDLAADVTCRACLRLLVDARLIVRCGHAFCSQCLQQHRGRCPECQPATDRAATKDVSSESFELLAPRVQPLDNISTRFLVWKNTLDGLRNELKKRYVVGHQLLS